jgi:hypothetical protein
MTDLLLALLLAWKQAVVIARVMTGAIIARVIARVEAAQHHCSRYGFLIARVIARARVGGGFQACFPTLNSPRISPLEDRRISTRFSPYFPSK